MSGFAFLAYYLSMMLSKQTLFAALGALSALAISGCAPSREIRMDSAEHKAQIQSDIAEIQHQSETFDVIELSLDDAIEQAVKNNLDARVSSIENLIAQDNISLAEFRMMPNVTASGTYTTRNNDAASSSRSVLTGTQSLEPSTSSDKDRRLADIEAQWNIVDAVIAYLDGKIADDRALVAQERLKKVKQNIEIDTINAYWRAYATQQTQKTYRNIMRDGERLSHNIDTASNERLISSDTYNEQKKVILDQSKSIANLFEDQDLAKVELKSLMAMPIKQDIFLTTDPKTINNRFNRYNEKPVDELVQTALINRPELREIYLDGNISSKNIEKELIRTFPGLNLIYSRNYDSNSFLSDHSWTNFSAALTQSITDFITLPTRYRAAQNQEILVQERRKALTAAIIAQVHIGRIRIDLAKRNYDFARQNEAIAKRQAKTQMHKQSIGSTSKYSEFIARSKTVETTTDKFIAFAELQRAYVDLYRTLGLNTAQGEVL